MSTIAQPELLWRGRELVTVLADAGRTGGAYTLMEVQAPRDAGLPRHVHTHEDEGLLVLEGALSVTCAERSSIAGPGRFCLLPRGVPHMHTVVSEQARYLVIATPGGLEQLVRSAAVPASACTLPPDGVSEADFAAALPAFGVMLAP